VKTTRTAAGAERCRRKFLRYFPKGFRDETYFDWERGYKWQAHQQWMSVLGPEAFAALLAKKRYADVAAEAVKIESRTNLLFSFEKMALRDAVRSTAGARLFSTGLYEFLHGAGSDEEKFRGWCDTVASLPRRQTRVLTWPLTTVWGFIAQPERHFFLKPNVTRLAARAYGHELAYASKPSWGIYQLLLGFAREVRRDLSDLRPKDMIDIQSFLWVQGSDEYPD
jgi:hypothetical protein